MISQEQVLVGIVLFLAAADTIFTMYTAELYQRKGAWHSSFELNALPRMIIGKQASYKKSLIWAPVQVLVVLSLIYLAQWWGDAAMIASAMLFGALLILDYQHLNNIQYFHLNKDNDELWEMSRKKLKIAKMVTD